MGEMEGKKRTICLSDDCSGHENKKKCKNASQKAIEMLGEEYPKCPNAIALCNDGEIMLSTGPFDSQEETDWCLEMQEKYGTKECDICTKISFEEYKQGKG